MRDGTTDLSSQPRWTSHLPETGPAWGLVYVTDTTTVVLNGQPVTLLRLSSGAVVVDADLVPGLRALVDGRAG